MSKYIITFDSGAPSYRCRVKKIVTAVSPADAVVKLMQSVKIDCIIAIRKLDDNEECHI